MNWIMTMAHWLENSPWGLSVGGSEWSYPVVQMLHFTGLSLWIGTIIAIDLRLMGMAKGRQTAAELSDALFAWNWTGLALAIIGGFLLFSIAAGGYVVNPAFEVKLGILIPLGLILRVIMQRKVHDWSDQSELPGIAKAAGWAEFLLWVGVATAAVAIPYF